jgi:DNA repair photolyase
MNSEIAIPLAAVKGRGAADRLAHRFTSEDRAAFDDGWSSLSESLDAAAPATELSWEDPRTAITRNASPDIFFDRSLNPYRGCEHGCIYCYARPTHSWLNLSPGLDFETRLIAKRGIADVLARELAHPGYRPATIAVGTATDAYQPIERDLRLTRSVLEVLHQAAHPVSLVTKSSGVERDIDLLAPMAARGMAGVFITLTTLDAALARRLEPRAAAPHRRLRTIRTLSDAGIPVGVSLAPHIPFLTEDMEQVLDAAREAGARSAFYHVLRLPWEVAPLFKQWLALHYPQRAERVMARVREMHAGKDYDSDFASRMKGRGVWANLVGQRFRRACERLGMNRETLRLDATQFRPPALDGQASLF